MSGGVRRGMLKGTGQRAKFKWSTKVPPCPQARRYISPIRLLGVLFFFFFRFLLQIFPIWGVGEYFILLRDLNLHA